MIINEDAELTAKLRNEEEVDIYVEGYFVCSVDVSSLSDDAKTWLLSKD